MKIRIQNQHGDVAVVCNVTRTVSGPGVMFLLTKQPNGEWTATVGQELIPTLRMLKSVTLTDRVGDRAVANFIGVGAEFNVLIRYVEEKLPYLHFDRRPGDQHLTMYVTANLMSADSWPAAIEVDNTKETK